MSKECNLPTTLMSVFLLRVILYVTPKVIAISDVSSLFVMSSFVQAKWMSPSAFSPAWLCVAAECSMLKALWSTSTRTWANMWTYFQLCLLFHGMDGDGVRQWRSLYSCEMSLCAGTVKKLCTDSFSNELVKCPTLCTVCDLWLLPVAGSVQA